MGPKREGTEKKERREVSAVLEDKKKLDEYLFCSVIGSVDDPDLWIADTGASVPMTPYVNKLTNTEQSNNMGTVTMGNGSQEDVQLTGEVVGMFKGKENDKLVRIRNVAHLKNGKFNLFSILQMLKQGWVMHGTKEMITISKDNMRLEFGIKILTSKGVLLLHK